MFCSARENKVFNHRQRAIRINMLIRDLSLLHIILRLRTKQNPNGAEKRSLMIMTAKFNIVQSCIRALCHNKKASDSKSQAAKGSISLLRFVHTSKVSAYQANWIEFQKEPTRTEQKILGNEQLLCETWKESKEDFKMLAILTHTHTQQ